MKSLQHQRSKIIIAWTCDLLVCVGSKDYPQGPCQGPADVPSAPHARSTRDRDAQ